MIYPNYTSFTQDGRISPLPNLVSLYSKKATKSPLNHGTWKCPCKQIASFGWKIYQEKNWWWFMHRFCGEKTGGLQVFPANDYDIVDLQCHVIIFRRSQSPLNYLWDFMAPRCTKRTASFQPFPPFQIWSWKLTIVSSTADDKWFFPSSLHRCSVWWPFQRAELPEKTDPPAVWVSFLSA